MQLSTFLPLALAVSAVHSYVIGGIPRPKGIPQTDTFDTLGLALFGTPVVFEDGPFVGGIEYMDLDVEPITRIKSFILQTFGFLESKVVVGGIVPHSWPNLATLPHGTDGRMVALAYEDVPPPCTYIQSSYVACSVITYNTVAVVPVAVPIGCKITWELYDETGNITLNTRQQVYIPDVAKVSSAGLKRLVKGDIPGFLAKSPLTSQMQEMQLDFPAGQKWGVRAEILDLPLVLPEGLPDNVVNYLNDNITTAYQNSIQLHIDDVTYTVVDGTC